MARTTFVVALLCLLLPFAAPAVAQEAAPTNEELLERIRTLEERLDNAQAPALDDEAPADEAPADEAPAADADEPEPLINFELSKSVKVRLGGKLRIRAEGRMPASYAPTARPDDDSSFVLQRTRLYAEFDVIDKLTARVELQDSRAWGETGVASDVADVHVREAYVDAHDFFDAPVTLRAGRYEVPTLGDGRLVNGLGWSNVTRRVDGVLATFAPEAFKVTGLLWNLKESQFTGGDANDDQWIAGLYYSVRLVEKHEIDAYVLWRYLGGRALTNETGDVGTRQDYTLGLRIKGTPGSVWYTGEADWQLGNHRGDQINAWAAALTGGVTVPMGDEIKLKIGVGYAYATGDENGSDGKIETFDPIMPFGHKYHGHMDLMGWRNMHAVVLQLNAILGGGLSLHAHLHGFWLAEKNDSWYAANNKAIRTDTTSNQTPYVGTELDVFVKYKLWERVAIWLGYSHFNPGDFVRDSAGPKSHMDWAFLELEVSF